VTNPLDMMGPEFLKFYFGWALCVFLLAKLARFFWHWTRETPVGARWGPGIYPAEGDAYAIALLRGGPQEVAVAILGRLVAESFLVLEGGSLRPAPSPSADRSRLSLLEEEAFAAVTTGTSGMAPPVALALVVKTLEPRLAGARTDLETAGLAPGADQRKGYQRIGLAALLLVTGPGAAKLLVAWMRGRGNVQILLFLLVLSVVVSIALMQPPLQTAAGKRYLKWLKKSHQGLVQMVSAGRRPGFGELALVAGIFGLEILPALAPLKKALIPPSSSSSGSSGSSGCGGGGGCGGGCGGCGG
jgi:uncharacterized protein (TIGR04222 family)